MCPLFYFLVGHVAIELVFENLGEVFYHAAFFLLIVGGEEGDAVLF